jgi:protein TIF31
VNSGEMVQELHQVLLEREATCHRTCFSLQLDGIALDHFTELKNIAALKDGSVLRVAEGMFIIRMVVGCDHDRDRVHTQGF